MGSNFFDPDQLIKGINPIKGFTLSPDGRSVAFARKVKNNAQIFIAEIDEFKPTQLTEGPGSRIWPCWSPDGNKIVFIDESENGKSSLYSVSLIDRKAMRLTELIEGSFGSLTWSNDGTHLAFTSNHEGTLDLYIMRAEGGNPRRLTAGSERDFYPQWSPNDAKLLFFSTLRPAGGPYEMRTVNRDGTGLRTIGPEANRNAYGTWSPDSDWIAFQSNAFGCFRIGLLNQTTEKVKWLTSNNMDSCNPVWLPDGKRVACNVNINSSTRIAVVEVKTGDMRVLGPKAGLCSDMEFTPDGHTVVFSHQGPRNPMDLWYQNLNGDEPRQLTCSLPDSICKEDLVIPEEVSYTSFDGLEIPSLLYRPRDDTGNGLPPAVIRLHGGPNFQTYNCWQPRIQFLVNHGYLVLAPNFRGSTGYGEEFQKRSIGDWGGGDLQDVIAAADWLNSTRQADPDRIALLGGSYGGYLMLMAMAMAPDVWAAGVDLFGFVDLETFHSCTNDWMREWIEEQIGSPEQNPNFYRERSPVNHCEKITAPLFILQGAHDKRVPLSQTELLRDQMKSNGKECKLKIYGDENHFFYNEGTQIDVMKEILGFYNRYLRTSNYE